MNPHFHRSAGIVIVVGLIALLAMELTIWSGPELDISENGSRARVESTFLGEYELGITRLRIAGGDSDSTVVDVQDPHATIPSRFELRVGENQIARRGGVSDPFVLKESGSYVLTLCGNNGWGRTGCSSKQFRLTR